MRHQRLFALTEQIHKYHDSYTDSILCLIYTLATTHYCAAKDTFMLQHHLTIISNCIHRNNRKRARFIVGWLAANLSLFALVCAMVWLAAGTWLGIGILALYVLSFLAMVGWLSQTYSKYKAISYALYYLNEMFLSSIRDTATTSASCDSLSATSSVPGNIAPSASEYN